MYYEYLKYVLEHKKNVFKTCRQRGLKLHALTHDLSKFSPSEFIPYAHWFNGRHGVAIQNKLTDVSDSVLNEHNMLKQKFEIAWQHHYEHNRHHWKHWCYDWLLYYNSDKKLEDCKLNEPEYMPEKYLIQMICDWEAMSIKFGGSAQSYYLNNYYQIELNRSSRWLLEGKLNLYSKYIGQGEESYYLTIGEILDDVTNKSQNPNFEGPEEFFNKYYDNENKKFDLNVYECLMKSKSKL